MRLIENDPNELDRYKYGSDEEDAGEYVGPLDIEIPHDEEQKGPRRIAVPFN